MSDDWVEKYIKGHSQREKDRQDIQKRRQFAEAGASEKFQRIREQIERDVQRFRSIPAFHALEVRMGLPDREFQVVFVSSPRVTLKVELQVIIVKCDYTFLPKDGGDKPRPDHRSVTLRICSDLDGQLTVYRNGSGEAFTDEADISEFLLTPILDHVDK